MAGLLELIGNARGTVSGYRDATRAKILQPLLDQLTQREADAKQQRDAKLLQPLLNQYGPDAAKAIGSAWMAGGPAADMANSRLAQAEQMQASKMPMEDQLARLPLGDQAQIASEQALYRQRMLAGDQTQLQIDQAQQMGPLERQAVQALIGSRNASAQASRANADLARAGKITQVQGTLNQRFLSQMDAPVQVADAVQQVDSALSTGNSLGVLAATIKLAKILDPTSVVREGEVTTVQGGLGVASQLLNNYNKLFGQGMSQEGAKAFQKLTKSVAGPVLQRGVRIEDEIRNAASVMEADPNMAATGIGWPSQYVRRYLQGMPDPNTNADFEL
jgi:hypothetical protein